MNYKYYFWMLPFLCALSCPAGNVALAQEETTPSSTEAGMQMDETNPTSAEAANQEEETTPSLAGAVNQEEETTPLADVVGIPKDEASSSNEAADQEHEKRLRSVIHDSGFVSVRFGGHVGVERVGTHTRYGFYTPEAGYSFSLDLGYRRDKAFVSGVVKARSGWALKDKAYYHYVNNDPNQRYRYTAINQGEWDGYFMAVGMRAGGFVDLDGAKRRTLSFSGGFDIPIGFSMDRENVYASCLLVFSMGFQHFITQNLSIGAALDLSFIVAFGPTDPGGEYFKSLNKDESLQGDPRYIYFEPSVTLHYYF